MTPKLKTPVEVTVKIKCMSQDWIDDCLHFYGKVLNGKYAHWCPEWDHLPIDETCEEFKCCICFEDELKQNNNPK